MCLFTALKFYNKMFSKRNPYNFLFKPASIILNLLMKYLSRIIIQVFKALVGALAGTSSSRAQKFVLDVVTAQLAGKDVNQLWEDRNPMGVLALLLVRRGQGPPESRLLWSSGFRRSWLVTMWGSTATRRS